jgi:hypothetical protein
MAFSWKGCVEVLSSFLNVPGGNSWDELSERWIETLWDQDTYKYIKAIEEEQ